MAFKFVILAACLAVANAGFIGAPAAVGASQQSVVRSLDGNSVVSTYAKQVDTPFSSVRKFNTQVSNDAVAVAHAPVAYAAPAYAATYAAPAVAHTYAAPAYHGAYAAPAYGAYAAPAYGAYAAPAVARIGGLGVAYSAAPAVAHYSFDGLGAHYAF
ncbi:hypothetical protein B566_EDAN010254 [Ephemera danica]|nr:hypothetical protein B566_EDAN010254 [Ephemera danica]